MAHNIGHHHQHKRKRIHVHYQQYPHPNKFINWYDRFIYLVGIIVPIVTSSQVFKIFIDKIASGVSIIAWSAYLFNSFAWLIYGMIHKEKPIIFTNIVCSAINLLVIVGAVMYG